MSELKNISVSEDAEGGACLDLGNALQALGFSDSVYNHAKGSALLKPVAVTDSASSYFQQQGVISEVNRDGARISVTVLFHGADQKQCFGLGDLTLVPSDSNQH